MSFVIPLNRIQEIAIRGPFDNIGYYVTVRLGWKYKWSSLYYDHNTAVILKAEIEDAIKRGREMMEKKGIISNDVRLEI